VERADVRRSGELVSEIVEPVSHVVAAAEVDLRDDAFTAGPESAVVRAFAWGKRASHDASV